jgi:tetratricopeptide (TPR) repeat protein
MKALRLKPDSIDVRNNLGMAYYNIGSYCEATKAFKQALRFKDDNVQAHYGLALVHIDLRLRESALEEHNALVNLGQTQVAAQLLDEIHRQFQ